MGAGGRARCRYWTNLRRPRLAIVVSYWLSTSARIGCRKLLLIYVGPDLAVVN
jgi:hypothetical protein